MSIKKHKWAIVAAICIIAGIGIGLVTPLQALRDQVAAWLPAIESKKQDEAKQNAAHEDVVALSEAAYDSLGIRIGVVKLDDYSTHFAVPARIEELPAISQLHVDSRFAGLVRTVHISQGESVRDGQLICRIELTSESLALAQSEFLEAVQQQKNVAAEITRVAPLVRDGVMARKSLLDLQYELKRLQTRSRAKSQELLVRGLTEDQVANIETTQKLIRQIEIRVPKELLPPGRKPLMGSTPTFIAALLAAKPGAMINAGDHVLELAYHQQLVAVGHAFEKDLPSIHRAIATNQPIRLTIGPDDQPFELASQQIAFISNHADAKTNSFPFYVYIQNEVFIHSPTTDSRFINWRWKPGQRAHIEIPKHSIQQQIVLPREAVAQDGINYIAFKQLVHDHGADEPAHEHMEEFGPIELKVLYADRKVVVVDPEGELKVGDVIATNQAQQLLYALKGGQGGGHGHDHAH